MIKRTSIKYINTILDKNKNWKVLDIGCGYNPHPKANTICDVQNLSSFYKDKKFIQLKEKTLPFKDNEFDFIIASHVLEHVDDIVFFIKELERISKNGYIEVPTKLEDNLVFENKNDHLWQMDFDDVEGKLIISKRLQIFEPVLTVSMIKKLNESFRKSLILELIWQDQIDYTMENINEQNIEKISLFKLLRKFISKKIRVLFK